MTYSVDINTERIFNEHILRYAGSIYKGNRYIIDSLTKDDERFVPILKIPLGITKIIFNENDLTFNYSINEKCLENSGVKVQYLNISSEISLQHIYDFLEKSRLYALNNKDDKITTRIMKKGYWSELSTLPKRSLQSVILCKNQCDHIVTDIQTFINSENEYLSKGIPYKRNYLLEGLPGTGKSSLIFAIASYLNMDMCIINLSTTLNDINIIDAVSNIPDKSLLVLEDIDCIFGGVRKEGSKPSSISLATIFNILDGVCRKHKMITFMTTNYVDTLDPALLRAGRIDYKLSFDYCNNEQTLAMYKELIDDIDEKNMKDFVTFSKKYNFTTATLQKFLFKYRKNNKELGDNLKEFGELCNENNNQPNSYKMYM